MADLRPRNLEAHWISRHTYSAFGAPLDVHYNTGVAGALSSHVLIKNASEQVGQRINMCGLNARYSADPVFTKVPRGRSRRASHDQPDLHAPADERRIATAIGCAEPRLRARPPSAGWSPPPCLSQADLDWSRHHEHRRVIVNIAGQFRLGPDRISGMACEKSARKPDF